jgi:DNA-binding CsgD family transcriptional regulator
MSRALSLLTEAGREFAAAGTEALCAGTASPAVELLTRACDLLAYVDDPDENARAVASLLRALAEAGQADQADAMTARVDELECAGAEPEHLVFLRLQLARADATAGESARGIARIRDARTLQVPAGRQDIGAALDAVEASLIAGTPGGNADLEATALARRALAALTDASDPHISCQAWEVLGILARRRDLAESTACFRQIRVLANRHGLPFWRLRGQLALGVDEWLATGATSRLELVRRSADRAGAIAVSCGAEVPVILDLIFRGRYREASPLIQQSQARASAAGLSGALRWLALARSALAAHQCGRPEMEAALVRFRQLGGEASRLAPLASLSRAVCALLEEDSERARRDLARAGPCSYAPGEGLRRLLEAIADEGRQETWATASGLLFWDQPFLLFRKAVLLGRQGSQTAAVAALARAEQLAEPYPLAHYLGLRLVAEAAQRDRWGSPAVWLRQVEHHFHQHPAGAVAGACRMLLRGAGAQVPQRRRNADLIPRELRVLGVTVREYEVLEVLMNHRSNRDIAAELRISLRTVEKHISGLLMKTGQANRAALIRFATGLHQGNAVAEVTPDADPFQAVVWSAGL